MSMNGKKRPVIGVTLDSEEPGGYSKLPWYALRQNYSDAVERAVTKGALARNMPVLGICGGQQLLNVVLGGTLIQHIPDEIKGGIAHEQTNVRTEAGHTVRVEKNTLLHRICGADELSVNSAHHQAVKTVGPGVIVDAIAPDGVIDGIEDPRYRYCIG